MIPDLTKTPRVVGRFEVATHGDLPSYVTVDVQDT